MLRTQSGVLCTCRLRCGAEFLASERAFSGCLQIKGVLKEESVLEWLLVEGGADAAWRHGHYGATGRGCGE